MILILFILCKRPVDIADDDIKKLFTWLNK